MARVWFFLAFLVMLGAPKAAVAQDAPYEADLLRLAEILGSLHYLRNICADEGETWRKEMESLLATENPDPQRRTRFIARFNRGYRSFETVYTSCTNSALESIRRYMKEGEALTRDVAGRYSN